MPSMTDYMVLSDWSDSTSSDSPQPGQDCRARGAN